MKKLLCMAVVWLWCAGLMAAAAPSGNTPAPPPPPAKPQATPGVEAAQALSTLTGVAISPMLGVSAVGAWKYWRTPPEHRSRLPWFARPWFWGPGLMLVLMVLAKDLLGPSVPTALKKPFDLAELVENKLSALVAAGIFVPVVASIFHSAGEESQLGSLGLAMINLAPLGNLLAIPLALLVFVVVFLAGHAVNVLILISPFATLDMALKGFRLFVVWTVAATSLASPYVGAIWALVIIAVSYFIAGWSLRLSVFGSIFAWDLATFRHKRFEPRPGANWVFTARQMESVPVRTWGQLERDDQGRLVLTYRPWLVLPPRTQTLPPGECFVGRGLFYPEIRRIEGGDAQPQLTLPPRYRTHEGAVARIYHLASVQDIGLRKGLKAIWGWLTGFLGSRRKRAPVTAPALP